MSILFDKEILKLIQILRNYLKTDYIFINETEIMISKIPDDIATKDKFKEHFEDYLNQHDIGFSDLEITQPNMKLGWSITMDRFYPCPKKNCFNNLTDSLSYGGHKFMRCMKCKGWYNLSKEPPVFYDDPLKGVTND